MIRGLDEELRAPKYAHIERERRFLVDSALRPDLAGRPHILIEDRYIDGTRMRLRRMTASDGGRLVMKLSKKYSGEDPRARPMVTTYLTQAEYDLLTVLPAHPLVKRRCPIDAFSIDVFEGRLAGLELAESEQPDAASLDMLEQPRWAPVEVTDDPRFDGGNLAAADRAPTA